MAVLNHEGNIELRCKSRYCGAGPGAVVIHVYHSTTGEFMYTKAYKDPTRRIV
jgi:hypothetical protein